jgi:hypothetical protein
MSPQTMRTFKRPFPIQEIASPHGGVEPFSSNRIENPVGRPIHSGDGGVTALHDNGGRILQHARLTLMFWGNAWTDPATTPSQGDFTNAVSNLLYGPWAALYELPALAHEEFRIGGLDHSHARTAIVTDDVQRD